MMSAGGDAREIKKIGGPDLTGQGFNNGQCLQLNVHS